MLLFSLPIVLAFSLLAFCFPPDSRAQSVIPTLASAICELRPSCEDRCREHSEKRFKRCVERAEEPEACAERARAIFVACSEENCQRDPDCKRRCRGHARAFRRHCVEEGHARIACTERARAVRRVCVEEKCEPEPTCEERCKLHSRQFLRRCVEEGDDPLACTEAAEAQFASCVEERCQLCLCPQVFDPVCGVDGNSYDNVCFARCARVEVAHEGPCEGGCECNRDCPDTQVCREKGACQPPCGLLCFVADPVCGSDGVTYICGEQDAACHGVSVLHNGPCAPVCREDGDCHVGALCNDSSELCTDPCGCADFCGSCICLQVFDPVCAADGRTYGNACEARCAHVEVVRPGPCEPHP
ncbi:MAG: hypothetical protein IH800_02285 [Myxococcales bacterium]|nr:hypothetical protein [Myxococcales bacterium]MCZ6712913.1 Kazal-type serine protease inhibitor domain-containing protein [Deltaproteobacteria bacterium]MCZ6821930.1 Kazal-type serine protease inhibitor domain-containing protein [Deltaproteobacteria bacterium]TDI99727.1 MAG: hypothetical protein E2O73_07025 [Deltaproteobacteria bacterium]TDJ04659.1 MAG: hypothetical protein E2O71_12925 [Deltaproteobacteria bacterium]